MSKFATKFASISLSVVTAVSLSGIAPAMAQSADLQAQIAALLAQIASLQSQLNNNTGSNVTSSYNFTRDLTVGAKGADVTALQNILISKGYLKIATATEFFGPMTQSALAAWQKASGISPAAGYFGPKTRSAIASVGGVVPPGTTVPPGTVPSGFSVSTAIDNPMSSSVPKGATGVTVLKFNVSGTGTLDSLVFKRMGIGGTADFGSAGLYLYDGNTRLTNGRSINSTTHEVSFMSLGLAVNGTKTLSLVADISSTATPSNKNYFVLTTAGGVPAPTMGTVMGNEMTIGGQSVGTITATSGAAPSNPKVGEMQAKLAEFKLTAGSTEDVMVYRVSLTEGGSIANSNLTNFVLKTGGNTVATASAIGGKDLVTFSFTSPYLLEKGQERTFTVYGDIAGGTRSADTVVFYFDSASDIYAVGKTYNYSVTPTISAFDASSEGDTLTLAGGELTITFNGPVAGDIAVRGQDVVLYDFTIASQNNVEIRYLRFNVALTGSDGTTEGLQDFKVWDATNNSVITSAVDIATTTNDDVDFNDVINLSAGQSKRFKVTADVDTDNDNNETVLVTMRAFTTNDVRNLDNNTYVSTSVIVPNTDVAGNTMTVKTQSLDVQLSATPTSQTYVRGKSDVALAGFSFRAVSGDIRVDSIRITATSASGAITSGDVTSLALYDGTTKISSVKSLDTSALNATFDNLNYTITSGVTKVLTLRGNLSSNITVGDQPYFYMASITSDDLTAYDKDGNAVTTSGLTVPNTGGSVKVTVADVGDVTVVKAADDTESEAGIIVADSESTLGKFRFTASNEDMTINKVQFLVTTSNSSTATSTAVADEVPTIKLYDGSTLLATGYVQNSGDEAGIVKFENLGWTIGKDLNKTLTVKGALNSIVGGADTGASVYVAVHGSNFEAQGASAKDTSIVGAVGNQKVVYKTKPTLTISSPASTLTTGEVKVLKFRVAADSKEQVSWKKMQFKVSMTGASVTAATTSNVKVRDVAAASDLSLSSAFSNTSATASASIAIAGGNTGYVTVFLSTAQDVAAGSYKDYELTLTFANLVAGTESASAVVSAYRQESSVVAATSFNNVEGGAESVWDGTPSFIWSDNSVVGHTESTSDWANGVYVKTFGDTITTSR